MKKYNWDHAQKIISDKKYANFIFFVVFTKENDLETAIMSDTYEYVENHFKNENMVKFLEVDIEEAGIYRDINNIYLVMQVPMFFVIKANKILRRGAGFYPYEIIIDFIEENIE
ncbi:hypothetical protein MCAL160_0398 [Mycoplasmopsis californica HAZ160_1]|uniref:Uncharacterized protein n=2 Tax=Mycoplasmopsis californica TaxID=2113 RepID=A0A059XR81_9BACT|nr:hypothetical protein [Mycoplasmopsis californica]AIA29560.1 hypothetical protein MCFN_02110 [Mycoplasmopsis californica]BAP00996.1 hypothetical protein MCAL160_0398 [Mycoplasmopsis californica HAZ160_1]BBG40861.1 hypothetical protein MCAL106_0398 [Mycoplasmopsis californica]BBG41455.1 hypothetical protein MCAL106E_0398 [Mycoplasmopsis californica]BBG42048.1 hypothetical protein MCAL106L_0398 [Mycoplasmopsis californica]